MWRSRSSASLRTQTRPAIEYVSGEEGLRPKSYFFVFSFLEYVFTVIQKYEKALGPHCGAEGRWSWRYFVVLAFHWRAVHQILSLLFPAQCTKRRTTGLTFHLPVGSYVRPLLCPCTVRRV